MSEPFLAEVRIFGFNFAPPGWATCDGQLLPIDQNQTLFSLLGTTYGGDGRTTFALPDLRGRVPIHVGLSYGAASHVLGERSGGERHSLSAQQIPSHSHTLQGTSDAATAPVPDGNVFANAGSDVYAPPPAPVAMDTGAVVNAGGGQGHENMQPFLSLNFCIALTGVFPSRD